MTEIIDPILFEDLQACNPEEVVFRTGCTMDETRHTYRLTVWNRHYGICASKKQIQVVKGEPFREYMDLFALHYLLKAADIPLAGQWVSEKDIPSGAAFFRGPHLLPTHLIAGKFEKSMDDFIARCRELEGKSLDMADAAFSFEITPKIPVAVLFWRGDEDFGAEAKLLFDKTIGLQLPLDIIYALAVEVCREISDPHVT